MKTHITRLLFLTLGVAALVFSVGAAQQGGESDPLVTVSYLDEVAIPAIVKEVEATLDAREQAYVDKLSELVRQYEKDTAGAVSGGNGDGVGAVFLTVTVPNGKTLTLEAGGELLLRSGSATCVAPSAPGLMDATEGSVLNSGGAVQPNHLYMITDAGRGLKASADAVVLVRGAYTLD